MRAEGKAVLGAGRAAVGAGGGQGLWTRETVQKISSPEGASAGMEEGRGGEGARGAVNETGR